MKAEDVCPRRDIGRCGRECHARVRRQFKPKRFRLGLIDRSMLAVKPTTPKDNRHAERHRSANHLAADTACPQKSQGAAIQTSRLRKLLLIPSTRLELCNVVRNSAIEREDQAKRKLGDSN